MIHICENVFYLRIIYYARLLLDIIRFVIPIILVVKLILDIYKGIINPNDKGELKKAIVEKITACIIVFLVPTLVSLVVSFVENIMETTIDYKKCYENATLDNINHIIEAELAKEKEKEEQESIENKNKYDQAVEKQKEYFKSNANSSNNSSGGNSSGGFSSGGTTLGQKYNLTEAQLLNLAKISYCEQGSLKGAMAEASLMANRYELLSSKSKYYNKGLHNYVLNCGWWHPAKSGSYKTKVVPNNVLNAIRSVLINGNRTLPLYVDEHDYRGDLTSINTNGKVYTSRSAFDNNSNYIQGKTVIKNKYGATYTFWTFPTSKSDPFGYTASAKNKVDSWNS